MNSLLRKQKLLCRFLKKKKFSALAFHKFLTSKFTQLFTHQNEYLLWTVETLLKHQQSKQGANLVTTSNLSTISPPPTHRQVTQKQNLTASPDLGLQKPRGLGQDNHQEIRSLYWATVSKQNNQGPKSQRDGNEN